MTEATNLCIGRTEMKKRGDWFDDDCKKVLMTWNAAKIEKDRTHRPQKQTMNKTVFVRVEFENGAVTLVNTTWLTPRKKEVHWLPYKTQFEYNKALIKAEVM
ncbi:hypothetical protein ILUMI_12736 [Ignelater luminosus]|uniref:Uncharacterized protein n=1 Tax=Ignelater luminosus TaxID=2038154 RepID=A0A8K0CTM2_IGNLU|nr:hypothetical protein ILUMI_12736 [Ignelater luminosus]